MTEIEKMERYIELTGLDKLPKRTRECYSLNFAEVVELRRTATSEDRTGIYKAIITAFDYGIAKGYRMAKAVGKV